VSIFGKPVKEITLVDLNELVAEQAQENIRLEFKRQPVDRDDFLKKISGFANTSGGYIIIGMAEGPTHNAAEVLGVQRLPSLESQVTAWCTQHLYPPLLPGVSKEIMVDGKGTVAYVIQIEESELAPHFIEGRQGCYIRTNEGSHKFEAKLASQPEIIALLNRREAAKKRAVDLRVRSRARLQRAWELYTVNSPVPLLPFTFRCEPVFPRRPLIGAGDLASVVESARARMGSLRAFPSKERVLSLAESLVFSGYEACPRMQLEITTFGTTSYLVILQPSGQPFELDMAEALESAYLAARWAREFGRTVGLRGLIRTSLRIENIRSATFVIHRGLPDDPNTHLDEVAEVEREMQFEDFEQGWSEITLGLWRELFFALGWANALDPGSKKEIDFSIKGALQRLRVKESFLKE
jgi:hypothetical protein